MGAEPPLIIILIKSRLTVRRPLAGQPGQAGDAVLARFGWVELARSGWLGLPFIISLVFCFFFVF